MSGLENFKSKIFARHRDDYCKSVTLLGVPLKFKRRNKRPELETQRSRPIQDAYDLEPLRSARRVIVFLTYFRDLDLPGMEPFFHLCRRTRALMKDHLCLVATAPGPFTYAVNASQPDEPVHRWEQIVENCAQAEEVYLHLPAPCVPSFYEHLTDDDIKTLQSWPKLRLNILHHPPHGGELAATVKDLEAWHGLTRHITLSTGVPDCATQEVCNQIGLPLYRLPSGAEGERRLTGADDLLDGGGGLTEALAAFYGEKPMLAPQVDRYCPKEYFGPDDYSPETTHAPGARTGPKPLLTAIVYTYNHQSVIGRCLESLVNQKTDYHYEIHVWDDCSIDGTSDICVRYARQYPDKIRLVVQKENTFIKSDLELQSYASMRLLDSKYFCFIDGDDFWCDENKVQIALDFLESHPEYFGFAHDTLQINEYAGVSQSYVHEVSQYNVENPVTLRADAPFFLACSRIFRTSDYAEKKLLPIDYKQYYYHLAQGPIYYYDKIMAGYVIGRNSTFASLGIKTRELNSMFPCKLAQMFNFQQDEFCTALQKKYDTEHFIGDRRYKRLCRFKKIFGVKRGWLLWFFVTFVPKFGLACLNENYIYSRRAVKKLADKRVG